MPAFSLDFDIVAWIASAKDGIDLIRDNQVGTYIDVITGVIAALTALVMFFAISSSRAGTSDG